MFQEVTITILLILFVIGYYFTTLCAAISVF